MWVPQFDEFVAVELLCVEERVGVRLHDAQLVDGLIPLLVLVRARTHQVPHALVLADHLP